MGRKSTRKSGKGSSAKPQQEPSTIKKYGSIAGRTRSSPKKTVLPGPGAVIRGEKGKDFFKPSPRRTRRALREEKKEDEDEEDEERDKKEDAGDVHEEDDGMGIYPKRSSLSAGGGNAKGNVEDPIVADNVEEEGEGDGEGEGEGEGEGADPGAEGTPPGQHARMKEDCEEHLAVYYPFPVGRKSQLVVVKFCSPYIFSQEKMLERGERCDWEDFVLSESRTIFPMIAGDSILGKKQVHKIIDMAEEVLAAMRACPEWDEDHQSEETSLLAKNYRVLLSKFDAYVSDKLFSIRVHSKVNANTDPPEGCGAWAHPVAVGKAADMDELAFAAFIKHFRKLHGKVMLGQAVDPALQPGDRSPDSGSDKEYVPQQGGSRSGDESEVRIV